MSLIVGHLKRDESAKLGFLPAHSANCGQSQTRALSDSDGAPTSSTSRSLAPNSPNATDRHDYTGQCNPDVQ